MQIKFSNAGELATARAPVGLILGGTEGVAKSGPETRPPSWVNKSEYLISLMRFEVNE